MSILLVERGRLFRTRYRNDSCLLINVDGLVILIRKGNLMPRFCSS